jgi:hypothetical protein
VRLACSVCAGCHVVSSEAWKKKQDRAVKGKEKDPWSRPAYIQYYTSQLKFLTSLLD